ncbi:hypothetical protein [Stratiformator vulcanicus]|nr:hypothetical protein [Stratiformator vulcanicus]
MSTLPSDMDRRDIALLAGDDLEDTQVEPVRSKVDSCPHCKNHWNEVTRSLEVLESTAEDVTPSIEDSVWPEVSNRIRRTRNIRPSQSEAARWVPAMSFAAACIALFAVTSMPGQESSSGSPLYHGASSSNLFDNSFTHANWQPERIAPRVEQWQPTPNGDRWHSDEDSEELSRGLSPETNFRLPRTASR